MSYLQNFQRTQMLKKTQEELGRGAGIHDLWENIDSRMQADFFDYLVDKVGTSLAKDICANLRELIDAAYFDEKEKIVNGK